MTVIRVENLHKHFKVLNRREGLSGAFQDLFSRNYRVVKAVDGISMVVEAGEMIGYLGPNGAGKSTTLKMMTGVLEPTSGTVLVNNNIPHKNRARNARNIGVVFGQRTQLWWDLPVIESFKLLKEIYELDARTYEQNMGSFNDLVGLKELYSTPVKTLSLGQRMLCDITAAFLHNPRIIFLDEPTIGLDVSVKRKIRTLIKDLNERRGTTIVLTTHDIGDIEALCKRIIIIDKGGIIYDGDIQRIKRLYQPYRTLKMEVDLSMLDSVNLFVKKLGDHFRDSPALGVESKEPGWIDITVNQDEVKLLDILNYATSELPVKDIKIEEVSTETVIRHIYEGALAPALGERLLTPLAEPQATSVPAA